MLFKTQNFEISKDPLQEEIINRNGNKNYRLFKRKYVILNVIILNNYLKIIMYYILKLLCIILNADS